MLIDSSVLIAFFNDQDNQHEKAKLLIEHLFYQGQFFYVSDHIFSETVTVLNIKSGYDVAKKIAQYVLANELFIFIETGQQIFEKSLQHFCTKHTKLSIVDITLLELAQYKDMQICTFDKQLQKAFKG